MHMFVRLNEYTQATEAMTETQRSVAAAWRELLRRQPGFKGYLTIHRGGGQYLTLTLWASEEFADHWRASDDFRNWQPDNATAFGDVQISGGTVTDGSIEHLEVQ
jgi:heme-degrading monooxygenase HmoA